MQLKPEPDVNQLTHIARSPEDLGFPITQPRGAKARRVHALTAASWLGERWSVRGVRQPGAGRAPTTRDPFSTRSSASNWRRLLVAPGHQPPLNAFLPLRRWPWWCGGPANWIHGCQPQAKDERPACDVHKEVHRN
jgi:hypothetical protein